MRTASIACIVTLCLAGAVAAQHRDPASAVVVPPPGPRGIPVDMIEDGSFEAGSPSPSWTEASTNFGSPLCTEAGCGNGGGTAGPRTGLWWAWFGGTSSPEVGSVSQAVQISDNSTAQLDFYFWLGTCGTDGDSLAVEVDGNEVWSDACETDRGIVTYVPASVDISAYADGGVHTIEFVSVNAGGGVTNYSVDDITLTVAPQVNILEIPTASTWGLLLLGSVLAAIAVLKLRS
ncbi:MAG: hypothetical protein DWQ36_11305 [Acidobacteria bacterium]|nr:MAG: hypothetical protein DWQ30_12095 [Acidobacteriota bacterium]REK07793.1 MAG: hypothetical protein DWQ36_11305 [Acidobacteriota bacterium]